MAKPKATHIGECQICGRVQKLPGGVLSLHGYTKRWGFFAGTCTGSGWRPFEQATDAIADAIKNAHACIAARQDEAIKLQRHDEAINPEALEAKAWISVYRRSRMKSGFEYTTIRRTRHDYDDKTDFYYSYEYLATGEARDGSDEWRRLDLYGMSKNMSEVVFKLNKTHIDRLAHAVEQFRAYIAWQEERVRTWKPRDLKPVPE
jgi:hypothetical protein